MVVDTENADESDFPDLAGGQDLEVFGADVALRSGRRQSNGVLQPHEFAVAFPEAKVDGVASAKHGEQGCVVYYLGHYVNWFLKVSLWVRSYLRTPASGRGEMWR